MALVNSEDSPSPKAFRCRNDCGVSQSDVKSPVLLHQLSRAAWIGQREGFERKCAPEEIVHEVQLCLDTELRANQKVDFR